MADVHNVEYRAIAMFLLEGGAEATSTSVPEEAERSGSVGNHVPLEKRRNDNVASSAGGGANRSLRCGSILDRSAYFEEGRDRAYAASHF